MRKRGGRKKADKGKKDEVIEGKGKLEEGREMNDDEG
jgi:hypothetical protein